MTDEKEAHTPFALELDGFGVTRGQRHLLQDLTWRVPQGQHSAIIGPNGSGKSTLLNAILTFVPASRGQLRVLGETYGKSDWRQVRRRIGFVSAEAANRIPPGDTALQVVASGAEARFGAWGTPEAAEVEAAQSLLEQLHCSTLERSPFAALSQGERQRVVIARALMGRPELLILDEPCTSLDAVARHRFLQWLGKQLPRGPTVLLVTHHPEEVIPGINHALLLSEGRALAAGPLADVLVEPLLSRAFGADVKLERSGDGPYRMHVNTDEGPAPK